MNNESPTLPSVQLSVLCGMERANWIAPTLHQGLLAAVTARSQSGWHIESVPGYDHRSSQEARNEVTGILLSEQTEWLLMVDNDTSLLAASGYVDPFTLVEAAILCGALIMGAPIPCMKGDKWHINVYHRLEQVGPNSGWHSPVGLTELRAWEADHYRPVPVDAVGTGMIAIHRSVFIRLAQVGQSALEVLVDSFGGSGDSVGSYSLGDWVNAYWNAYAPPIAMPHWLRPRQPSGATIIGEDIFFCERARAIGIQPYILPAAYSGHYHTYEYSRAPQLMFALAERPTAADYGLDSLHGLEPGPMSIQPWQAAQLRRLMLEAPFDENAKYGQTVIEFGGGISSLVLLDALPPTRGRQRLLTIESDADWATMLETIRSGMDDSPTSVRRRWGIRDKSLHNYYVERGSKKVIDPTPFVFIDGPQVTEANPKARWNTLPSILPLLADGCLIVMDDFNRESERGALEHWQSHLAPGTLTLLRTIGPPDRLMAAIKFSKMNYSKTVSSFLASSVERTVHSND